MYPETELTKAILLSEKGQELLGNVPPVYSDGYVALWLFEVIGRELGTLAEFVDSVESQVGPSEATWSLDLWEDALGIRGSESELIEYRRQNIADALMAKNATPYRIKTVAEAILGFGVDVVENTGTNKFTLECRGAISSEMEGKLIDVMEKTKPAHLVFDILTSETITNEINEYLSAGMTVQSVFNLEVTE